MNIADFNRISAARSVFEKQEEIEKKIREEELAIRVHKCRMMEYQKKMDVKKLNACDRGRTRGWKFTIIGSAMLTVYLPFFIGLTVDCICANDFSEFGLLLGLLFFVIQPLLAGVPVLCAYYKCQAKRRQDAETAAKEYEAYKNDTADPEIMAGNDRIAQLRRLSETLLAENSRIVGFLPECNRNYQDVSYMLSHDVQEKADDLEKALRMCCRANSREKHLKKIRAEEKRCLESLGFGEYVNVPSGAGFDGAFVGMSVANAVFDSIFG